MNSVVWVLPSSVARQAQNSAGLGLNRNGQRMRKTVSSDVTATTDHRHPPTTLHACGTASPLRHVSGPAQRMRSRCHSHRSYIRGHVQQMKMPRAHAPRLPTPRLPARLHWYEQQSIIAGNRGHAAVPPRRLSQAPVSGCALRC